MTINIIVAVSQNNAIGKNNRLLWHMPEDLKHFKTITSGHTVVMGRKTYDSVGRPLPNRRNIVITRQDLQLPGCEVVHSLADAMDLFVDEDDQVFIVGGAEIYRQALDITDRIYLTVIHKVFEGDTFFPQLGADEWAQTARQDFEPDDKNPYPYSFITLERR